MSAQIVCIKCAFAYLVHTILDHTDMNTKSVQDFMDRAPVWEPSVSPHREGAAPPSGGGLVYGRRRDRSGPTGLGMGLQ